MEEYLRRVQSRLGADVSESGIHAVVGGLEPDVDTVAATLCLALHLSQKEPSGGVCVPVLCGRRGEAPLPEQTVNYLQGIKVSERSLLWKEDVDLVRLHHTGKLSLTLLRDGLLDSSEYHTLESSILRVVHHDGQQDTGDDEAPSAVATVSSEILQEAAEHIRATLGEILGGALRLQQEALWLQYGRQSAQLEELMASLEQWRSHQLEDMMQRLTAELKEFSDGEMTVALTSLTTDKENFPEYVDGLKSFTQQLGYEGLVVLMSISDSVHHPRQQVAVYSNNTDMLNQICSELEESSSWSLSGELEGRENLQVYHIPINTAASSGTPPLLEKEIHDILKDFVDRRSSVLACHPSSRTSSTEGVAGSVEFSQGSSGINDMDGSDIERTDGGNSDVVAISRAIADGDEDPVGSGVSAGGELVSPDSGMTTIRSSRSSKESSVFLSDDSPVGELMASGGPTVGGLFLRNPSPLGLLSLSPPIAPERRKHRSSRNKSDNFDLFNFDPLHSSDHITQARGELANSSERGDEGERGPGSSSLSEIDELSLLDFSAPCSLGELETATCSIDHHGHTHGSEMLDTVVPPTPVNSLVGSRPPSSCGVRFFPEDVIERINGLQHKDSMSSSLSETWDELGFETPVGMLSGDGNTWNRLKDSQSPQNIIEEDSNEDLIVDMIERESREEIQKPETTHQRAKGLKPQLSLITDQTESYDNWNPGSLLKDQWDAVLLTDLQLTPPEDGITGKCKAAVIGSKDRMSSLSTKTSTLKTLTPDTSKEEDEGIQEKKKQMDFWTYTAQKGFLKSDSATTTSYPESLDMWNMTIRDDSLSPLTTPDNLSENSCSFYGIHPNLKSGTSLESPLGYSDGGMQMWNTTIQEDSSSTITSPEGPENEKSLSHMGSSDANDTLESPSSKQVEDNKATNEDSGEVHQTYKGNEINVTIVIDTVEDQVKDEETGDMQSVQSQQLQKLSSKHSEVEMSAHQGTDLWDLSVHGMVTSTSEYDNIGAGTWSLTSSPDTYSSPVVDMIQLEDQSSPFITVTKPFQMDESCNQSRSTDPLRTTEFRAEVSDEKQSAIHVFLFGETSESSLMNKSRHGNKTEETDSTDQPGDHSPFLLVDHSPATSQISQSEEQVAKTHILPKQSFSPSLMDWDSLVSNKHGSDLDSSSHNMTITVAQNVDVPIFETQGNYANVERNIAEAISLSSSPGGERDAMNSPDSLQTGSQDKHGSSSDGDSFSGLEMESIVVSGTVKEAKGEWCDRPKRSSRQSKETKKSMETFSMLSYAATILQSQAKTSHRNQQESNTYFSQIQCRKTDTANVDTEQIQDVLSTHLQISADNATKHPAVPELISHSQSKNISEAFHQSESEAQPEEEQSDNESGFVARSVSPSIRYPSDHFLKTREEVYVHSQISMEDSDEGGQSPSAPPQCPTSLGDFQTWGDHLVRQDTSQTTSEPQSPVFTNSSVSHTSSSLDTPVNDLCVSMEKGLGLPFSGDLMEEENDEEHEEEIDPSSLPEGQSQQLDLLSFTEDLTGGPSFQGTDLQTLEPERKDLQRSRLDYYHGQALRADSRDKWSIEVQTGDHEASQVSYSPVSRRHQEVTSQLPPHPTNENPSYHWTPSLDTTQGQTQYGYNYHHIDQRTENQCSYSACSDTKSNRQPSTTDVYAEFTSAATNRHYRPDPTDNYYEAGDDAQYNVDDAGFKCQYVLESQYEAEPSYMCASEAQYSPYQESGQSLYESAHAHYQADGESFYRSEAQPETEDHARYVPDGYVHFMVSRNSQQSTMVKMPSSEEAAEELDNREDPPSSTDVSGGSNQRRKLAAPPLNVSLDRSEGSLLSDDALDTEDDGLDTGDDLDVNIDELDTPDETDSLDLNKQGDSEESILGAAAAALSEPSTGHQAAEASRDSKLWRSVVIGEQEHRIDMKCIEPYKRVISHGGYYAEKNAIIVFAACFLPDSDCDNYNYVMENLFLYVISTLELMVAEDYMIVYLNGATPRRRMPGFTWMKRCYQMIDRRLKKNLKMFIIVHPSWFIRTLLGITRPFISSKFSSKIKYVNSLRELGRLIPMEYVHIPPSILKYDEERATHKFACTRNSHAMHRAGIGDFHDKRLDTDLQDTAAKDGQGNSAV